MEPAEKIWGQAKHSHFIGPHLYFGIVMADIFVQWAVHRYWLIFMVVDRKCMEDKQNKQKLSTMHLSFSEKFNEKIPELRELC